MSIENEIQDLTQSTTDLLNAVNTKKVTLDNAVSQAQTAVTDATSQVSLAAAEKVGAQTARDEAETHKNQAYTYSQSAASAVAYQDLTAIAQTKSESAVDVFVYDTSKDSDGGAWRHRTQHTSWYNETLNTATRGSRKEFPAVAVIVAESNKVTIYDGDDPSLPMWMVFERGVYNHVYSSSITSVTMLNGQLLVGEDDTSGAGALCWIDIIGDRSVGSIIFNLSTLHIALPISGRNSGTISDRVAAPTSYSIVNRVVNDVAMTVLPDAPIDPTTGLPIPTIAVATDGGVSVIKDDGTVVDITANLWTMRADEITFTDDNYIAFAGDSNTVTPNRISFIEPIPSNDLVYEGTDFANTSNASERYIRQVGGAWDGDLILPLKTGSGSIDSPIVSSKDGFIFGNSAGLGVIDRNKQTPSEGMAVVIKQDYNTGWMNGDIKLATLSDTDDTDLVGSELVTNGTFDTDTSGWSSFRGASISYNSSSNALTLSIPDPSDWAGAYQAVSTVVGKTYFVTGEVVDNPSGHAMTLFKSDNSASHVNLVWTQGNTSPNVFSMFFTATSTTSYIGISSRDGSDTSAVVSIDNISVRLAEPDRSVNNNGLQVFGTVQKNPVATGADLVAYSGFSASNYLQQPYNPDLDFGTGDFCIMGWVNVTAGSTNQFILSRYGSSAGFTVYLDSAEQLQFRTINGGVAPRLQVGSLPASQWIHIACLRFDGVLYSYVNGELKGSLASTVDISSVDTVTNLGVNESQSQQFDGSIALFRISGTAPTAEQVKKIYEDEKVLFQENAKATLHGTSDAVTALAYDEDTGLLSVGTSSGRSDFRGLRRVNNTTDAVSVAISASNGLIVEE